MTLLLDPAVFWMLLGSFQGEPIVLDPWQIALLRDYSRFRALEKAPQIGYSWLTSAEAVWEAMMFEDSASGFVSVDLREAQNKILYARQLYDGLPPIVQGWIPVVKESTEEVYFGADRRPSRVMSFPNSAGLRGYPMNVYLDECDHYRDGGFIAFRAAIGRVSRGFRLTMGSTCFGSGTKLAGIMSGEERRFTRVRLPWIVAKNAESIEAIHTARDELDPSDFEEEYECVRGGGADLFTPELLRRQTHGDGSRPWEELPAEVTYAAGYDVGAGSGHPSVLSILAIEAGVWMQRTLQEIRGLSLPRQYDLLVQVMEALPGLRLFPDEIGVGHHISQALVDRFGRRVVPMRPGTVPKGLPTMERGEMLTEIRRALEAESLMLVEDLEQQKQFRRTHRTDRGRIEQEGSRRRDHYDKFWATTYAWWGTLVRPRRSVYAERGLTILRAGTRRGRSVTTVG